MQKPLGALQTQKHEKNRRQHKRQNNSRGRLNPHTGTKTNKHNYQRKVNLAENAE